MRRLDSLFKENIMHPVDSPANIEPKPISQVNKTKKVVFPLYYFYRSLRIAFLMWVLLLVAIIVTPWLNYYIKSSINTKARVLGAYDTQLKNELTWNPGQKTNTASSTRVNGDAVSFYYQKKDLEIKAPIVEGITDSDLTKGIGHHPDSVWPNQKGNVVIAGHSFSLDAENIYGQVFARLRDLEIGDFVSINYQNKKYTYKIFKKETVSAKDVSMFGKTQTWQLTFYTCDPPKTDWRRLVFQAELIKVE